jgi:hypothetical protein
MNNETFNKNYGSLFSINKINQVFENTFDISKNSNINENNQKKFDFSMTKSKSIKNIKRINDSTKETGSISLKSLKPANDNNNSNIHDENNIPISNFLKYDLNC